MQTALKFIYILSICFWIGSIFFFSFLAAPSIFKVLPRETAGNVVSDIFPKYYLVAYVCGGAAIVTTILLRILSAEAGSILFIIRLSALVVMLALAVYAGAVLRPQAVEVRTEMREELSELEEEIKSRDASGIEKEWGDLVFSLVNLGRHLNLDAEGAAHKAIDSFIERFGKIEDKAESCGKELSALTLAEMDELWEEVKRERT